MNVTIYGCPYHSLDYHFYTEEELVLLFTKYENMNEALNYIDGGFAIKIQKNTEEIWITDYYNFYPIFYNPIEKKVCVNFVKEMDLEINENFLLYNKIDDDDNEHVNTYINIVHKKYLEYMLDKNISDKDYKKPTVVNIIKNGVKEKNIVTPWKNWFVVPCGSICKISNDITITKYNIDVDFHIDDDPRNIILTLIESIKQKNINILTALTNKQHTIYLFDILKEKIPIDKIYLYDRNRIKNTTKNNSLLKNIYINTNFIDDDYDFNKILDYCFMDDILTQYNGMIDLLYYIKPLYFFKYNNNLSNFVFLKSFLGSHCVVLNELLSDDRTQYNFIQGHIFKMETQHIPIISIYNQKRLYASLLQNNKNLFDYIRNNKNLS